MADIGTKSLAASRIIALLKLANVAGAAWSSVLKSEASPEVCMLRGLCSWSRAASSRALQSLVGITEAGMKVEPAVLFVLTLLAAVRQSQAPVNVAAAYVPGRPVADPTLSDVDDDSEVDRVPHRPEALPEPEVLLGLPRPRGLGLWDSDSDSDSDSGFNGSSTTCVDPREGLLESVSDSERSAGPEHSSPEPQFPVAGTGVTIPVFWGRGMYSAAEQMLLVHYVDDVLEIPLPGWPQEAIQAIIAGIGDGDYDWTELNLAINGGQVPSLLSGRELASGSADQPVYSAARPALGLGQETAEPGDLFTCFLVEVPQDEGLAMVPQTGIEMLLISGLGGFLLGLFIGSSSAVLLISYLSLYAGSSFWDRSGGIVVCTLLVVWSWSVVYRGLVCLNSLLREGLFGMPYCLGLHCGVQKLGQSLTMSWQNQVQAQAQPSAQFILLLVLILLFGLADPFEARLVPIIDISTYEESPGTAIIVRPDTICTAASQPIAEKGYGVWWLVLLGYVTVVVSWEAFRWTMRKMCHRKSFKTAESQTEAHAVLELPLSDDVPDRARILFSLWRAGFSVDFESYPVEIQDEYHGYVGAYLLRQARNETDSECGSSG